MLTIHWSKFKNERGTVLFIIDLIMVLLVVVNLLYIFVEFNFTIGVFNGFLKERTPGFFHWYNVHLHRNFFRYDIYFVTIFIAEFCVRWFFAIYHQKHHKWFFYPFLHWYDVLGLIPLGPFRFLRIFRVASMVLRLHKMGAIDLRDSYAYRIFERYRAVIVEEISDRVVVNVLNGVQDELRHGSPVVSRILVEVIGPQKEILVRWLSDRITQAGRKHYGHYHAQLRPYVNRKVAEAVRNNTEVRDIAAIPVVGSTIIAKLERAVADITYAVIDGIATDLTSEENAALIDEFVEIGMDMVLLEEEDRELNELAVTMVNQSIDIIKEQVEVKRWMQED